MKALILVGGFGTRLRPLTLSKPKPLVEFANKGIVLHQIEALAAVGCTEVVLAVNYRPDAIAGALKDVADKLHIKITYSQETEPLGTAGPLALAREHLIEGHEPFFVLNSDVTCIFPFKSLLAYHKAHGGEGTIMTTKVEEPSKYGVVVSTPEGQIQRFVEKPKEWVGNQINAGIYLFNKQILDRIQPKPTSIEKEIFPVMAAEGKLFSMVLPGFWMDVGQPKDFIYGLTLYLPHLLHEQPELFQKAEGIVHPVLIDPTAKIGPGCLIGPHVAIGPNCIIEEGVRLNNCAILEGATVKAHAWVSKSIVGWASTVGRWCRLQNTTVLGQDVHLSDELFFNGALILPHKSIAESAQEPRIIM